MIPFLIEQRDSILFAQIGYCNIVWSSVVVAERSILFTPCGMDIKWLIIYPMHNYTGGVLKSKALRTSLKNWLLVPLWKENENVITSTFQYEHKVFMSSWNWCYTYISKYYNKQITFLVSCARFGWLIFRLLNGSRIMNTHLYLCKEKC